MGQGHNHKDHGEDGTTIPSTMRGVLYRDERFLFGFVAGLAIAAMAGFIIVVSMASRMTADDHVGCMMGGDPQAQVMAPTKMER